MTQITISKSSSAQWTATFNNPPINLIDPDTIGELQDLVAALESDAEVKVVVFRTADPDFFLAHWDVLADKAKVAAMPPGPTGLHPWVDVLVRLSRTPVASIAEIRGRARGAGSEFALACDMRFASREPRARSPGTVRSRYGRDTRRKSHGAACRSDGPRSRAGSDPRRQR